MSEDHICLAPAVRAVFSDCAASLGGWRRGKAVTLRSLACLQAVIAWPALARQVTGRDVVLPDGMETLAGRVADAYSAGRQLALWRDLSLRGALPAFIESQLAVRCRDAHGALRQAVVQISSGRDVLVPDVPDHVDARVFRRAARKSREAVQRIHATHCRHGRFHCMEKGRVLAVFCMAEWIGRLSGRKAGVPLRQLRMAMLECFCHHDVALAVGEVLSVSALSGAGGIRRLLTQGIQMSERSFALQVSAFI